jgi:hypothetical protein
MLVYGYLRLSFDRKLYMNLYWVASYGYVICVDWLRIDFHRKLMSMC